MNLEGIVRSSKLYSVLSTLHRWFSNSTTQTVLAHDRALEVFGGLFVLFSVVRVLTSNLDTSIKFLSFALLFAIIAGVSQSFIAPSKK